MDVVWGKSILVVSKWLKLWNSGSCWNKGAGGFDLQLISSDCFTIVFTVFWLGISLPSMVKD